MSLFHPTTRMPNSCSLSVRHKIRMAISREWKELPKNRWCQMTIFLRGFSDFKKILDFWISEFLDFWIFIGFLWYLCARYVPRSWTGGNLCWRWEAVWCLAYQCNRCPCSAQHCSILLCSSLLKSAALCSLCSSPFCSVCSTLFSAVFNPAMQKDYLTLLDYSALFYKVAQASAQLKSTTPMKLTNVKKKQTAWSWGSSQNSVAK